jgi:hypothetical protein
LRSVASDLVTKEAVYRRFGLARWAQVTVGRRCAALAEFTQPTTADRTTLASSATDPWLSISPSTHLHPLGTSGETVKRHAARSQQCSVSAGLHRASCSTRWLTSALLRVEGKR